MLWICGVLTKCFEPSGKRSSFQTPLELDEEVEMGKGRRALHGDVELSAALHLIQTAATVQQLRQGQAMLLPALTGVTMATTAKLLGVNRDRVFALRRDFRKAGNASSVGGRERRGGRRHAILSLEEERLFMQRWQQDHKEGVVEIAAVHIALEEKIGRSVSRPTVLRLVKRHNWRNISRGLWYFKTLSDETVEKHCASSASPRTYASPASAFGA